MLQAASVLRNPFLPGSPLQERKTKAWVCVCLHPAEHGKGTTRPYRQADKTSVEARCLSDDVPSAILQQQVILRFCNVGLLEEALNVMSSVKTALPDHLYISILKLCNKSKKLVCAKYVYDHVKENCSECSCLLLEHLVVTMAICGDIEDASKLFNTLTFKTVICWTAIITSWIDCGQPQKALEMYDCMENVAVEPNHYTFVSLFKACGGIPDVKKGKKLHADVVKRGLSTDTFVANSLVSMYGKFGAIKEAENVFQSLSYHDLVSWNAMLSSYIEFHHAEQALMLYRQMQKEGVAPNHRTFAIVLQACSTLKEKHESLLDTGLSEQAIEELGHALHADAKKAILDSNAIVGTSLVSMYSKCGKVQETENTFRSMSWHDAVSWTAMQSAYVRHGHELKALHLFVQMQQEGISPNQQSYLVALQACVSLVEKSGHGICEECSEVVFLTIGKMLYECAVRKGHASYLVAIKNAFINLLGKCGAITEAEAFFCALFNRDIVSWNTMLSAYVEQGKGKKALQLFKLLTEENVEPDELTLATALKACGALTEDEQCTFPKGQSAELVCMEIGVAIHGLALQEKFGSCSLLGNTLVRMYGKFGMIAKAEEVFWGLTQRDVVSWNSILSAYVEQGQGEKVLLLYKQMQREGACLNEITVMCVLKACSELSSLEMCRSVHFAIISSGWDLDLSLAASLIHAYGSCGNMVDAQLVLRWLPEPVTVSWNACLDGYVGVGNSIACANLFSEMQECDLQPDEVTFASLLSACSHGGLIQSGFQYFESMMVEYGITPDLMHFSNLVNLFGRTGNLKRVMNILESMPMPPDLTLWSNLLLACGIHGNVELGQEAFKHAVHLQSKDSSAFVFMSNLCAEVGLPQQPGTGKEQIGFL
ncbi:hypothetical protein GOP47_0025113 [Adiantum capillus-veneris]|uniref:Pentatricopeptide repeat-containing protein n=1 Tax=Adiantum capillus-veneris TaxID=13818 RepID=A0A9D4U477_ADICA|nr:hypothetical protein GOP47_0025113 [Adiantum capillus-veneris]